MELTIEKIKYKTTEEKDCEVTFSVQIPSEIVKSREEEVMKEFQKAVRLPGFRQGKAPEELVRKNFSGKVQSETLEQILKDAVPQILKEKSIYPVATPVVEQLQVNNENVLSFNLKVERNPEFKVKDYTKIPVEKRVREFSDIDVQREISQLQERNAQLVPSQIEKVEAKHIAVIHYSGYLEGQPIQELKAENHLIDLSAPQSIQGFAEGILGQKRGETKEITVPFPKEYPQSNLAGKTVIFKVTVTEIKDKVLPSPDDEFAKDLGCASMDDLRTKIMQSLKASAEKNSSSELEKQLFDQILKVNLIPVPPSLVALQLESLMRQAKQHFARQGVSEKKWEENQPTLLEKYRPQAERQVRISYLLRGIARQEKLEVSEEELKSEMEKLTANQPEKSDEIKNYFQKYGATLMNQLLEEKVMKFLTEHAKIKEIKE